MFPAFQEAFRTPNRFQLVNFICHPRVGVEFSYNSGKECMVGVMVAMVMYVITNTLPRIKNKVVIMPAFDIIPVTEKRLIMAL
jgi:hypothetical protein